MKDLSFSYEQNPIHLSKWISENGYSQTLILCDQNTKIFCLPLVLKNNPELRQTKLFCMPLGEKYKTLKTCEAIWKLMFSSQMGRDALFINLGGGVVTDTGGFAAAAFKRGIDFIHIPTTLLAMADAAMGGKTGVNFYDYKNGIGSFATAQHTFIFNNFLQTLPPLEILSGYAEIIKHALLHPKANYWKILKKNTLDSNTNFLPLIQFSNTFKNKVIQKDFYEKNIRKILNFGHTIGHAIESASFQSKNPLKHGIAIAAGMIVELKLSIIYTGLPEKKAEEFIDLILSIYHQHLQPKLWNENTILHFLKNDKKNISATTRFVLLENRGKPQTDILCQEQDVKNSLRYLKKIL